ncbi:MAG: ABC transporter substrate-binding protein [Algoriphagus sp.]|nr:ABC transporter substrate-binding protein [Algoriphagus sp.]
MKTLRITGVPEHFNLPWKKVVASQPFAGKGIQLSWTDESRGSGQMNKALREDQTDIAIVLTESFLKDFEEGNPSKIIGFHVKSPLIWGIQIPGKSPVENLNQIEKPQFLISRMGSGSHLMAFVLAQREGWNPENLEFKIVGNLDGALAAMNPETPEMFLWEKYTTNPWVISGDLKRIGEVPSPWPCFIIVASDKAISEFGDLVFELRDLVYKASKELQNSPETPMEIHKAYELELEDVKAWLSQTNWETEPTIAGKDLEEAMSKMKNLGIIKEKLSLDRFLSLDHLQIT